MGKARVRFITTAAKFDAFTKRFGSQPFDFPLVYVDWAKVAKLYDGIIIAPYISARRLAHSVNWYYTWDCASGCIWNPRAIKSIKLIEEPKRRTAARSRPRTAARPGSRSRSPR